MLGERSPLARLEERDAKVLLLGVGWDVCTAFHLAEYRGQRPAMEDNSFAVMTEKGREWITVLDVAVNGDDFGEMGECFESERSVFHAKVGGANARLFSLADAVKYAEGWLPLHRPSETKS
jgi:aminoglycoside 3-N-acetyltransferase